MILQTMCRSLSTARMRRLSRTSLYMQKSRSGYEGTQGFQGHLHHILPTSTTLCTRILSTVSVSPLCQKWTFRVTSFGGETTSITPFEIDCRQDSSMLLAL